MMGNLLGGGAKAAKRAGQMQQQAANTAAAGIEAANTQNRALAQPRIDFANEAMPGLRDLLGLNGGSQADMMERLQATPGYQWRLNEGQRQQEGSAAARGLLFSGRSLLDSQDLGQRIAADTRQQEIANLMSLMGSGDGLLGSVISGNASTAVNAGNARMGGASAYGQGLMNAAQARGAGINELIRGVGGFAGGWGF
jgi:hypothetical protein